MRAIARYSSSQPSSTHTIARSWRLSHGPAEPQACSGVGVDSGVLQKTEFAGAGDRGAAVLAKSPGVVGFRGLRPAGLEGPGVSLPVLGWAIA